MIKKILICLGLLMYSVSLCFSQNLNQYKYVRIVSKGDPYDIETNLRKMFEKTGFAVISEAEELAPNERLIVLDCLYEYEVVWGAGSPISILLVNYAGKKVFAGSGTGCTLGSVKGDFKIGIKKIGKKIEGLGYHYTPTEIKENDNNLACSKLSEDSIKRYLTKESRDEIEGIYKNFSNTTSFYKFALLKEKEKYYAVLIESNNADWKKGDIKMILEPISGNVYDAQYFSANHTKLQALVNLKDGVILNVNTEIDLEEINISFLKIFPSSQNLDNETNNDSLAKSQRPKSTGSGIVIANNIIATNYHVVEKANSIKVVMNREGEMIEYNAKVLCVDKTNDLALLSIKDPNFVSLATPPYLISQRTSDVGTSIFTMGFPMTDVLGSEVKITDGIISSNTGYKDDVSTYQISAPIQPGNSGGGLFDKEGNLIGITNAGVLAAENVGYAIKSSYLINLIESAPIIIDYSKANKISNHELPYLIKSLKPYVAFVKIY